jgi:hypothetical protein
MAARGPKKKTRRSSTTTKAAKSTSRKTKAKTGSRRKKNAPAQRTAESEPAPEVAPTPASSHLAAQARRLETVLRALPGRELTALVERLAIPIDKKKRIDGPAQVARSLARLPDLREPTRLPPASVELLRRIVEVNGSLEVTALPAGLEALVRRGIAHARVVDAGIELVLPTALLVQIKSWEGEDPRSLRALLAEAPFETASAIATHYLGRPSTPPIALSLEPAWEVLGDLPSLRGELERASHQERRLLDPLEQVGGEVDTQELMDLEREPMRVRGAYGVAAGRRGAAFSLEKRGLLFPVHPNRYVIPTEVAALIGAERRKQREQRREEIRSHVIEADHLPRRASFSVDPAPLTLALAMALRELGTEVKTGVGTPRSLVSRLAQRFGRRVEPTALIVALSRAIGLWERAGVSVVAPPGSLPLAELTVLLFDTWRRGGAWDAGLHDSEMLRVAAEHRDPSPVGVLREMVLDALRDLGEGQWVPYAALYAYIEDDPRTAGLERLLTRWARRVGLRVPKEADIVQRLLLESLPTLGVVDVGGADKASAEGSGELSSLALRLTSRGRQLIGDTEGPRTRDDTTSELVEPRRLRIGSTARAADVLELSTFCEIEAVEGELELSVSPAGVSRGLADGISAAEMRARLQALVELSDELCRALKEAGTVIGRATLASVSGFLWIEDNEVREMLRTMQPVADLFLDPSPPTGLLVAVGVDQERLVRRCRALGVEVDFEEGVVRARHSTMPPPKRSETNRKTISWRPPPARPKKQSG